MGQHMPTIWHFVQGTQWYFEVFHHYFKVGGPPCDNHVGFGECCVTGLVVDLDSHRECLQGGFNCIANPDASASMIEVNGPYDTEQDCKDDNPGAEFYDAVWTGNITFVLGIEYAFFPNEQNNFEIVNPIDSLSWGFFCDKSQRNRIHIQFEPDTVYLSH